MLPTFIASLDTAKMPQIDPNMNLDPIRITYNFGEEHDFESSRLHSPRDRLEFM